MANTFFKAVLSLAPSASFSLSSNNDSIAIWSDDTLTEPSQADIEAEVIRLEAEDKTQAYARNRQAEYPDYGTQLNKIYDDGLTKWKSEMVDPVKAKWPKDNSGPK